MCWKDFTLKGHKFSRDRENFHETLAAISWQLNN